MYFVKKMDALKKGKFNAFLPSIPKHLAGVHEFGKCCNMSQLNKSIIHCPGASFMML